MPDYDKLDIMMKMLQIIERDQELLPERITDEQQAKARNVIQHIENSLVVQLNLRQETNMRDQYNAGQAGAMGPNASATGNTFQQMWQQSQSRIDLATLAEELDTLRKAMKDEASEPEHDMAVGAVAAAQKAAAQEDGPKVLENLRSAGSWALDVANKIGVGVATAAIKTGLGL